MLIALMVLIGIAAAAGGYLLQNSGLLRADAVVSSSDLRLNELMSDNASTLLTRNGVAADWIELVNAGSEAISLEGYSLMLDSKINKVYSFPRGTLAPGECAIVYAEGMGPGASMGDWSAPFRLPASGGVTLVLLSPGDRAVDSVELPELGMDEVYARAANGEWEVRRNATPGVSNDMSEGAAKLGIQIQPDAVELSEVASANTLYFADENGECHDYVELHNTSGAAVRLGGWYLSDSISNLKRWKFPDVTLPADGYLAVHCSGYDRKDDAQHLHTDFRIGEGESVYLSRPDGRTVSVASPPLLMPDQAWSLFEGAWSTELAPTPGMENSVESAGVVNQLTFGERNGGLSLSEVMASGSVDEYDWVEIYNGGSQQIDLSGYGLSDNPKRPRKWQFPQGTVIQPGQYLDICLSGTDAAQVDGAINADFAIPSEGGCTVSLANPDGRVLDAIYLPVQYGGISYGRAAGESGFFYFAESTRGAANTGAHYRARAERPQSSVQGGLFTAGDSFSVELTAPEGSRIYYTLDCSDPTERSTLYTGPITVSGTTILRSRVYQDGLLASFIDTQSYLYDVHSEGAKYVVSLVSDMDNLASDERGIMVRGTGEIQNYMQYWEREGHVEIFTTDGEVAVSEGCGLSLHGVSSRRRPVKTFNVIARSQYGANRFNYPLFSGRDYDSYQSLVLRPSGEDQDMSFMRDTVLTSLMKDSSLLYQEHEICVVYLDGEYYTLCYLRERINRHSVCQFEGWEGMEDDIDLIAVDDRVKVGSNESYEALLDWIRANDTSTDEAYAYLDSQIDIQNYIEYMAAEIFTGNTDTQNIRRYRNAKADGKWRWVFFDMDWAFFNDTDSISNWLDPQGMGIGQSTDTTLFRGCMRNPTFRDQFLTYLGEMLATTFSTENVLEKFEAQYRRIEPLLPEYVEKWNYKLNYGIRVVINYAKERPAKLIGYFKNCKALGLTDADMQKYFGAAMQKIAEGGDENA